MSRLARWTVLCAASFAAAVPIALPAAQTPDEPLGDLLNVIPLPEGPPAEADAPASSPSPPRFVPAPAPSVPAGNVLPVDLPPSAATGEPVLPDEAASEADLAAQDGLAGEADLTEEEAAAAAADAAAEAAWAAIQEQRRAQVNAVEAPIVAGLNAEMAARAEAEGRRMAEERAAYEQSLIELEEQARRREAEHAAAMEAHARRIAREQAEYRARVEACLAGDRRACEQ